MFQLALDRSAVPCASRDAAVAAASIPCGAQWDAVQGCFVHTVYPPGQGNAGLERGSTLLWESERPQGGREATLRVTVLSELQKQALLHCNWLIILHIACAQQVTRENISPPYPSFPSLTLATLIFISDLTRGFGRAPCTCMRLHSSDAGKWL